MSVVSMVKYYDKNDSDDRNKKTYNFMNKAQLIIKTFKTFSLTKKILSIFGVLLVLYAGYAVFGPKNSAYHFITVIRGPIEETVSVTGNTTPISSVNLGFGNSGNVAHTYVDVGTKVQKGQLLAELNTTDLYAQIKQAQANVDAQQAKLEGLQAGSRPEDIAAAQAALEKAQQDLANMYASVKDTSTDSYTKAIDAVRVQLDQFFSNAETNSVKLTYGTSNFQAQSDSESQRIAVTVALNNWQTKLSATGTDNTSYDALLTTSASYLTTIQTLLQNLSKTLEGNPSLSGTTLATYKANLTVATNEVNTAVKNINVAAQGIASQKLIVAQLQAQLDLKKAGYTAQDIAAQQAQVASAEAAVQSIEAKLQNSRIVSPIDGVVTVFDAKVGQFASPGVSLVSVISNDAFEIDALLAETDIGKVSIGNTLSMTIDAFPGETFTGTVFYIDPAQTTIEGVVGYKIKMNFTTPDSRMKSGLTANIDIMTRKKDSTLILPQSAILQNDKGTFVQVLENKTTKDVPVVLGLQDKNGNVEIISGVTEGEQVLNIGLKQTK